jgi:N-acetylmuramoyl-L-alanine amidase
MTSKQVNRFANNLGKLRSGLISIAAIAIWLSIVNTPIGSAQPIPPSMPANDPASTPEARPPATSRTTAPISAGQPQTLPTQIQPQTAPITPPKSTATSPTQERILVTIDPGHGGKDPGAIGVDGLPEIAVILPIAQKVATILREKGIEVQMTRDDDSFVGLDERVNMSRQAGATLFVSIHANSIDDRPDVNGLETYHYNIGEEFAQTVHQTILDYFNLTKRIPLEDRRVRSARFLVLRKSTIPAILVETGYLSSPQESPHLGDIKYQTFMAEAIAQGILAYIKK